MTSSSRCAACRHLRKRCPSDCIFSPYFPSTNRKRFEDVHKIYGASNISKMLKDLPVHLRADAADSLCYEAYCRRKDPVYGSVGVISVLQQQMYNLQTQLAQIQAEIAVATANNNNNNNQIPPQPYFDGSFFPDQNGGPATSYDPPSTWFN
ncbi:hypothetical protein ACJIZ3_019162 [Penstemon smallii]|uniref:LOB domain-containing protein n=1 Tax=Penstemon smallii TaxID=265156 RepID=A0ABD3T0F5_9LAMI